MNLKKYMIATLVVYVVFSALGFFIHTIILSLDYAPLADAGVLRPENEFNLRVPLAYLANLIFALAFCAIYTYGYEPGKNWLAQGVRYGLLMGTLLAPMAVVEYVVYPLPGTLTLKWILFGYFQVLVSAVVLSGLYTLPAAKKP